MMRFIRKLSTRLGRDQRGLSTMEYSVLFVVVVVAAVSVWKALGSHMVDQVTKGKDKYVKEIEVK